MTLYELIKTTQVDYDTYDKEFDAEVTVCFIEDEVESYDKFCNGIIKKVNVVKQNDDYLIVDWTKLIRDNMEKFRMFTDKHLRRKYKDDEDEFICQWINEIHLYMVGYVSEDFYDTIVEFVDSLEFKEE